MQFSIKYDPYSPTADDDYAEIVAELRKFDILEILRAELSKSRIHIALAKKVVSTIRYLPTNQKNGAILSIIDNVDLLYPIMAPVLSVIRQIYDELSDSTKDAVSARLIELIRGDSHVLKVELNLAYAVRVLSLQSSVAVQETLARLYADPNLTPLVRRDIILAMARLRAWPWLSDRRTSFRSMSPAERRAFLIASYTLRDEGRHWRRHVSGELSPMEALVKLWAESKVANPDWNVPL